MTRADAVGQTSLMCGGVPTAVRCREISVLLGWTDSRVQAVIYAYETGLVAPGSAASPADQPAG